MNNSTGTITVNASGGGTVTTLTAGQSAIVAGLTAAGTTPAAWYALITGVGGGVTSFQTSLSGLTPSTATTGAVTLAGTLGIGSGGTGLTTTPSNGQLLVGNGAGYTLTTLTQGTGITITNGAGTITIANAGVTSWSSGTTGLTPSSATTGAVTLAGTLIVGNGGTGQTSFGAGSILLGNGTSALASLADVAVGSVLTSGGVGVNPTWTAFTASAVASTIASRDGNANTAFNNLTENLTTTATAAGTTTLTAASSYYQVFTGVTTQTVSLPAATVGQGYYIINNSTGAITVNASGGGTVVTLTAGQSALVNGLTAAGTTPAAWYATVDGANGGVTSFSAGTTGLTPSTATTGAVTLAGTLVAANGGTGQSSYTVGDLLYASGTTALSKLADVATGNALISGGVGVAPNWGKIGLTTHVTGILPSANGGTGLDTSTATNGQLLIGNGSGLSLANLTQGTGITITNGAGTITIANSGVTSWSAGTTGLTPSSATTGAVTLAGTLVAVNGGTGFSSYTIGDLIYANTTTTFAKLSDVAAGSYLRSGGVGVAPVWSTLTLPNAATTGDLLYASASNTISNLADVATGNALISGGVGVAPSWGKIGLTTHVTGVLPIANGGTNSSTALNNNRIMVSSGGSIVEAAALTNGQLLIGSTGAAPVAAALTQGTGITITNGAGSITIANAGVTSITGTTNQVSTSASTGAVTLSTPSTFIAPGTIQDTTGMKYSTTGAISAAGATQATATALTTSYNIVTTVAASTGVALPVATAGLHVEIVNRGANTLNVYPANGSGASIDGAAANAAVTLPVNGTATYVALSATQWYTVNPPVVAGSNVTVTYGNGQTTVASTGGSGTPGGVNTNVQYNNSGAFGGSNAFNFVDGVNPVVNILGTGATTQLTIGGTTTTNNAAVYIEVNTSGAAIEGLRTYFNRNSAGINGWITYDYDGNTPNIRITDEDDDPPYIQFNTIGSGTYTAPQFSNIFGSRGPVAGVTTGFSWKVSGTEVATMDSQWFLPPAGTTAQRPTPTAGMFRYNSTITRPEIYVPNVWMPLTGIIDKSTTAQTVTSTGTTNLINYTLPGGTLTTTGVLRIRTGGIWNNGSGAGRTVVMTISYGGTTMWQSTSASLTGGATIAWNADLMISSNNSANAQALTGVIMLGSTTAATTGTGNLGTNTILGNTPLSGTSAVASGSNQAIVLSINISGGATTWTKYFHTIELL